MVIGLRKFAEAFADHTEEYVLIGGTACTLVMNEAGLNFRATKDFDIVLCASALNTAFFQRLWGFIEAGSYASREKTMDKSQFYRFSKPQNVDYPYMLELFSRAPPDLDLPSEPQSCWPSRRGRGWT